MATSELWQIIAQLGVELHPDRIEVVASKLEVLVSVDQFSSVKRSFGPNTDQSLISRLDSAWFIANHVQPGELAAALRGASATAMIHEKSASVELVWSGPSVGIIPVRHTEQVLCEVINSASNHLFIVSFVAYEVPSITKALQNAISRNVKVNILFESSIERGGRVNVDSVKTMKETVPEANYYLWQVGTFTGAVHAKCAVSDGHIAFITSANLTMAAMERNIELGVLVKGGHLPEELRKQLDALVATGMVERV